MVCQSVRQKTFKLFHLSDARTSIRYMGHEPTDEHVQEVYTNFTFFYQYKQGEETEVNESEQDSDESDDDESYDESYDEEEESDDEMNEADVNVLENGVIIEETESVEVMDIFDIFEAETIILGDLGNQNDFEQ